MSDRLSVRLGPLVLRNPILTASGTFGYGLEFTDFVDLAKLGGLCTKGLSLKPHAGNAPPRISFGTGGLSGPAIKPIAVRMVYQVARALPDTPLMGIGGIASLEDVLEFLAAGASAVQIGTANFKDPGVSGRLVSELAAYCGERGTAASSLTGRALR